MSTVVDDEVLNEEMANVDPTPIDHPVDNEALATAVHETVAEQVGMDSMIKEEDVDDEEEHHQQAQQHQEPQEPQMEDQEQHHHHHEVHSQPHESPLPHVVVHPDYSYGSPTTTTPLPIPTDIPTTTITTDSTNNNQNNDNTTKEEILAQTQPRKRVRRAGKVDVSRKVPKMEVMEDQDHDEDDGPPHHHSTIAGGTSNHHHRPTHHQVHHPNHHLHHHTMNSHHHQHHHHHGNNPEIQALAEDPSDPIRQEAAARVLAAEAAIPKVISKHEEKWNWMFDRLVEFRDKFKHTNVPQMYADAPRLGRWVHYQRVEYWVFQDTGGGKISPDRIQRLESIGFEWNPQDSQWKTMFERLQAFQQETGHCRVPKGYQKDVELANWVRNQRLEHANNLKGKKSRMTADRYHKLSDLGFKWSNLAANKVVNPLPFHEQEETTEAVPIKEDGGGEGDVGGVGVSVEEEDIPIEARIVVTAHETSEEGLRETSEV